MGTENTTGGIWASNNNSPCRLASNIFRSIVGGDGNNFFIFVFKQTDSHFQSHDVKPLTHAGKYEEEIEVNQGKGRGRDTAVYESIGFNLNPSHRNNVITQQEIAKVD